jgi:ATP-dependent RNA helicase RhlE
LSFDDLGLRPELLAAVAANGYTIPTPIQAQAIPQVLARRDVLAGAQTGTGKTAAFTLPLLQLLAERPQQGPRKPRCLVLAPTRELAAQVEESIRTYGKGLPLRAAVIFGGVGITPQIDALRRGVDIVVATPGRLLDHAGQRSIDLSRIEILVLDEADRMLDMGFIHDIRRILKLLPAQRQNLLFSATYSDEIRQLADGLLDDPALIEVARRNTAAELVSQVVHPVAKTAKRHLLTKLIWEGGWDQVLVFSRTKHGADRLSRHLVQAKITAAAIHGDKSQGQRTRALEQFKAGKVRALVATDIAARGLDIVDLPHVVNYDLPQVAEDYVHRIGRTGRAGASGSAISLVSLEENPLLRDIQRLLKREIPQVVVPGFAQETAAELAARPKPPARGGRKPAPQQSGGGGGGGSGGRRGSGSRRPRR